MGEAYFIGSWGVTDAIVTFEASGRYSIRFLPTDLRFRVRNFLSGDTIEGTWQLLHNGTALQINPRKAVGGHVPLLRMLSTIITSTVCGLLGVFGLMTTRITMIDNNTFKLLLITYKRL